MSGYPRRSIPLGGIAPHIALVIAVLFLAGCDGKQPLAPGAEAASLATSSGSSPTAPSGLTTTAASYSQIDLAWKDNSGNESGFEVHRSIAGPGGSFTLLVRTGANATSYSNSGLTASTQSCYEVRAFRTIAGGKTSYSAFSNVACVTTPPPPAPAAPSGADAIPISSTTIRVNFVASSTNASGYRVERSVDAGATWTAAGAPGPDGYVDTGRTAEQPVCYRVVAFNAGGESAPSNVDCTTPPAAPAGLTAIADANHPAIDLTWSDNSAVEDGYEVLRDMGYGYAMPVFELPANTTRYRDTAVGTGPGYTYYVRAKKDGGISDQSQPVSAECISQDCPVSCTAAVDCSGGYTCDYATYICVSHCTDGIKDGDESDVDCGGQWCAPCQAGQTCNLGYECASGSCIADICQPPGA